MKQLLAFCLSLLLMVSVIAGCGSTPKSDAAPAVKISAEAAQSEQTAANSKANVKKIKISEDGAYTDKEHVAAYINEFAKLPHNYITKNEAKKLGWQTKGTLDKVAPGKSIGGDRFGNYEGKLPAKNGRSWKECDIDYVKGGRNGKRLVFSSDGLIYYTGDHYKSFTRLY